MKTHVFLYILLLSSIHFPSKEADILMAGTVLLLLMTAMHCGCTDASSILLIATYERDPEMFSAGGSFAGDY